ncbi:unnamed protein product [Meloidogyne enterolobii]|uniref:Uncharacterized protein n=1 Tax=Meloidogyne enterolobii TaxID=390850 RepID=A0ACB1AIA3_MELEN
MLECLNSWKKCLAFLELFLMGFQSGLCYTMSCFTDRSGDRSEANREPNLPQPNSPQPNLPQRTHFPR